MKMFLNAILVFTLIFGFISCSRDNNDPVTDNQQIKNGSKWTFKITKYNESGALLSTDSITLTASLQTIGGSSWYVLSSQTGTPLTALQKRSDGWWTIPFPNTTPTLWYKTPAAVNDTYQKRVSDGTIDNAKVMSITSTVTVPAGTYNNCTKVDCSDTNSLENEFWFTDAGPVILKTTEWDAKAAGPASNVYMSEMWELKRFIP